MIPITHYPSSNTIAGSQTTGSWAATQALEYDNGVRINIKGPSILGVLSISSKHLNFLDLELKENSRKIKLLEIGLEDQRSVDPNLCPKNCKTFLLPYQLFL